MKNSQRTTTPILSCRKTESLSGDPADFAGGRLLRRLTAPAAGLALVASAFCAGSIATASIPERPNIIFIMADDLGYHDLGSYGQELIFTPHLDLLAEQGIRFTDVYAGSTVCAPARSALMTGHHTGNTIIRGNFPVTGGQPDMYGTNRLPLPADTVTLADVLKSGDYFTGMTGKWGLGEDGTTGEPNLQGFDEWFGFLNQRHAHTYYPTFQWLNGEKVFYPGNEDNGTEHYSHDLHTEFALDFIRDNAAGENPFFLYVPYQIPHSDYEIPSLEPYQNESWSHDAKVHAAMITRMDKDIGRMMDLLEERNIADKTLVFFTSDNGAARRWEGTFKSSYPLRGRKRDLYEGGIRAPMIVVGPGIPAGVVSDAPWYFPDVMPTLAEITGTMDALPDDIDGVSVVTALTGGDQPELRDRPMYWEFFENFFDQAIRWRNWKAVRNGDDPLEIYDLDTDIGETNNIADEQPHLAEIFEELFIEMRSPSIHWPSPLD